MSFDFFLPKPMPDRLQTPNDRKARIHRRRVVSVVQKNLMGDAQADDAGHCAIVLQSRTVGTGH
jgi:hypothetical protein